MKQITYDQYEPGHELTAKEAAEATGYHRRTIVEWIRQGILPASRRPGTRGHYRIEWKDLYQTLHSPARQPPEEPTTP